MQVAEVGFVFFERQTMRSNIVAQAEFFFDGGKTVPASICTLARSHAFVTFGVLQLLLTCYLSTSSDLRSRRCALPKPAVRIAHCES